MLDSEEKAILAAIPHHVKAWAREAARAAAVQAEAEREINAAGYKLELELIDTSSRDGVSFYVLPRLRALVEVPRLA